MLDTQLYITRLESQRKDMYFDYVSLKRMVIDEIQLTDILVRLKVLVLMLTLKWMIMFIQIQNGVV